MIFPFVELDEEKTRFSAACNTAEDVALRLVGRAEQNSQGLRIKLQKKGFENTVIQEVISRLLDRDLLNDARYAELWLRSRISVKRMLTPLYLRSSLGRKGIDIKSSQKALEKVLDLETEYLILVNYIEKAGFTKSKMNSITKTLLKKEGFSSNVLAQYYSS